MLRHLLFLASVLAFGVTNAQKSSPDSINSQLAKVNVFVTDMKGQPAGGEQVIFRSDLTNRTVGGRSDAKGRFNLQLPAGATYQISLKSLTDTSKYGVITIPALQPDEFFTEPFTVNVKFEPAKTYTLDNVQFDFGKATLRTSSFTELNELVAYLKNKPAIRVEIAGHTDNVGAEAENVKLSRSRADAIRSYVIKKGIAASRVTAKGYGATEPVADNGSDEGRQINRRTEVRIL
ncbi:MAG: OmpA family protein [Chitinophagaceae bacterium]|nr:OmpA family protein [Chitinophagaceae bacterium]